MIPVEVESFEKAAARYPQAIERVWDGDKIASEVKRGLSVDRPGLTREHVFDLEGDSGDVWRLIISRETYKKSGVLLHVSASRERAFGKKFTSIEELLSQVGVLFRLVANWEGDLPVETYGISPNGILHLLIRDP